MDKSTDNLSEKSSFQNQSGSEVNSFIFNNINQFTTSKNDSAVSFPILKF